MNGKFVVLHQNNKKRMQKQYKIEGMGCQGCVNKVKKSLATIPNIRSAYIQLNFPQATLSFKSEPATPVSELQETIGLFDISAI